MSDICYRGIIMDKDTIEFMTYKELADAIKTIRKYCYKQLGCSLQEAVEQFDKWII